LASERTRVTANLLVPQINTEGRRPWPRSIVRVAAKYRREIIDRVCADRANQLHADGRGRRVVAIERTAYCFSEDACLFLEIRGVSPGNGRRTCFRASRIERGGDDWDREDPQRQISGAFGARELRSPPIQHSGAPSGPST